MCRRYAADGTHPHRWTPARVLPVYDRYGVAPIPAKRFISVENYICHNGAAVQVEFS
jgi:hypothetical protein